MISRHGFFFIASSLLLFHSAGRDEDGTLIAGSIPERQKELSVAWVDGTMGALRYRGRVMRGNDFSARCILDPRELILGTVGIGVNTTPLSHQV